MTRVLIVGKTRMQGGVCLGGLLSPGCESVRLVTEYGPRHSIDTPLNLGDVWNLELESVPEDEIDRPHTEDTRFAIISYVESLPKSKVRNIVLDHVGAPEVYPNQLFNELIRFTPNKRGYVSPEAGITNYSVAFWRLRKRMYLKLEQDSPGGRKRPRYVSGPLNVPYIGLEEPIAIIEPGTLLRFSLSRPIDDDPRVRCWVMLSGWFL